MTTLHRTKRLRTSHLVQSLRHDPTCQLPDSMDIDDDEEEQARVRRKRLSSFSRRQDPAAVLPAEVALQVFEKLAPADLGRCAVVSRLWYGLVNDQQLWKRLFHWKFTNSRIMRIGMDQHLAASKRRRSISHAKERGMSVSSSSTLEWVARSLEDEDELPSYATCWKALYKLNYNWLMGQPVVICLSLDDIQRQDRIQKGITALQATASNASGHMDVFKKLDLISTPLVQFMGSILATATNTPWGPMVHFWRLVRGNSGQHGDTGTTAGEDDAHRLRIEYWQTFECPKASKPKTSSNDGGCSLRTIVTFELDRSLARRKSSQQSTMLAMVGYDTGEFTIFEIDTTTLSISTSDPMPIAIREIGTWNSDVVDAKSSKLRSSCFHYPMVTTYCTNGTLSIFKVSSTTEKSAASPSTWCRLLHRMHGRIGESPVEMEVEEVAKQQEPLWRQQHQHQQQQQQQQQSNTTRWLVRLAFGVPLLDGSWTMRLQEIELDDYQILDCGEIGSGSYHRSRQQNPAFAGWDDSTHDFEMRDGDDHGGEELDYEESHSLATVTPIASISLASPYLVTTHRDNTMNVFRIQRRRRGRSWGKTSSSSSSSSIPWKAHAAPMVSRLKFWHMSTLYGHCGAVSSASIDARLGRLVSASMDRSVKIWRIGKSDGHDEDTSTPMHRYYHHREHQRMPVPSALAMEQAMEQSMDGSEKGGEDTHDESWPLEDGFDEEDYDPDCLVSMSVNDNSWVRSKRINHDEGVGLAWIGSDDEKIVSVSVDGMIRVWRFT
ncbi:hypothetical protein BGZ73_003427 [Actinomortierella ambigua]|nr:hypothetical protein BGZ73_003427 [Actinomortierella ambigua]